MKQTRYAEWIKEWCKETARNGLRSRIQDSVEAAVQSGMSDEIILNEAKKAIRRAKRKRAKYETSDTSSQHSMKLSPVHEVPAWQKSS